MSDCFVLQEDIPMGVCSLLGFVSLRPLKTNCKYFSVQRVSISVRTLLFGRFPGFARLLFWQEQRVDGDE